MNVEEAQRMLWKVFDPSDDTTPRFDAPAREQGTLSPGVRIEAPFTCTYGYNLKMMDDVYIGKGTTIDDAGKVEIGARTWIGPNVTILTTDCSKVVTVDRKGSAGTLSATNVYIEADVVIGANALIFPGVRLGRGSVVEPGAIVKEPLGDNQIDRAPEWKSAFHVALYCR
jgi:acetyltransferase-like isoleucine patch superfamily enzyme